MAKLLPYQREDFLGIFKELKGLPATIRFLDPPLHEFLPHTDAQQKELAAKLGVEADKVTENASFIDDLGADSLDTVELVMAFEEEFGCEIPDDAAETILTVGDAVKFLEKNAKS